MIFTQFNMEDALKYNYEEGVEDGVEIGKEIGVELGKELSVIRLICSKLQKGKSQEAIAEALELAQEYVEKVQAVAQACGYDEEKIYRMLKTQ